MDKLSIVIDNYIDVECDANTTPRQAYERGFRRATEKCETVMRSRKIKNDQLKAENAKLREQSERLFDKTLDVATENAKLRELVQEMYGFVKDVCELRPDVLMVNNVPDWQVTDYRTPSERYAEKLHELGIEVGE